MLSLNQFASLKVVSLFQPCKFASAGAQALWTPHNVDSDRRSEIWQKPIRILDQKSIKFSMTAKLSSNEQIVQHYRRSSEIKVEQVVINK